MARSRSSAAKRTDIVADEDALGDLQLQPPRREPGRGERAEHRLGNSRARQLRGGDVHGDAQLGPCQRMASAQASRITQSPIWWMRPASSMIGTNWSGGIGPRSGWLQRSRASRPTRRPVRGIDDRLVMERQPVAAQRIADVVLEAAIVLGIDVHLLFEEGVPATARFLAAVQRQIGAAHQRLLAIAVLRRARNADGGADMQIGGADSDGAGQLGDDLAGEPVQGLFVTAAAPDDCEFVAAEATDDAIAADAGFQPAGDFAQQLVADRMAERVVDQLEAVEIDQQQGAGAIAADLAEQRFLQLLAQQQAVGNSGQRVEARGAHRVIARKASVGDVGSDAAPALEAAFGIDQRLGRDRPPAAAVVDRNGDVAKGGAFRRMQHQPAHAGGQLHGIAVGVEDAAGVDPISSARGLPIASAMARDI